MNYLLLTQVLIILIVGMKLGIGLYKRKFGFEFYTDLMVALVWTLIILVSN